MTLWGWILLASVAAYLTKLGGYLVPARFLQGVVMTRVTGALTIGLLASLAAVNTFSAGMSLAVDARVGALLAAAVALWCRAPFLAVVMTGAAVAALLRLAA